MERITKNLVPAFLGFPELDDYMASKGFQHDVLILPCFVPAERSPNLYPEIYVSKRIAPLLASWSLSNQGWLDARGAVLVMGPGVVLIVDTDQTTLTMPMLYHRQHGDLYQVGTYLTSWMKATWDYVGLLPVYPNEEVNQEPVFHASEFEEDLPGDEKFNTGYIEGVTDTGMADPPTRWGVVVDDNLWDIFSDRKEAEKSAAEYDNGRVVDRWARAQEEADPNELDDPILAEYFNNLEQANLADGIPAEEADVEPVNEDLWLDADPEDGPAELKDVLLEEHTMPEPWMRPAKGEQN